MVSSAVDVRTTAYGIPVQRLIMPPHSQLTAMALLKTHLAVMQEQ